MAQEQNPTEPPKEEKDTPPKQDSPHRAPTPISTTHSTHSTPSSPSSSSSSSHHHSNNYKTNKTNRINKKRASQDSLRRQWIKDHDVAVTASDYYSDDLASPMLNLHRKRTICVPGDHNKVYRKTFRTLEEYEEWHEPVAGKVDDVKSKPSGVCEPQDGLWRCVS
ncbi:MAG: hypothetical protein Q9216_005631 [Gyalolechia sp. 2 TL-2023]